MAHASRSTPIISGLRRCAPRIPLMPESLLAPHYVYVLVRSDLPLADQIVQVGHACLEAGSRFPWPEGAPHLVVLSVRSQAQLRDAAREAQAMGIRCVVFDEPDDGMG